MAPLSIAPRRRAFTVLTFICIISLSILFLRTSLGSSVVNRFSPTVKSLLDMTPTNSNEKPIGNEEKNRPHPKYKPTPTYIPPPVKDPFPLLATSTPPPIPKWNIPRPNLHQGYDLPIAPPLLIGFTRSWPILLQAVVSYIAAGWPPSQIYVVENTGVQQANTRGQLSLQNPFYLNHTVLRDKLGVNIIQTPVLLSFAQLQNFFLSLSYAHNWPYYFWSHMDVLVLSYEEGGGDGGPAYDQPGYRTVYELCLEALADARTNDPRWALRFFAYDHLALVNPRAYEAVDGWDTLIPYYFTDCDMHSRLAMANWTALDRHAGIITDVSTALEDLRALYRDPTVVPAFTDPNPPPPEDKKIAKEKREEKKTGPVDKNLDYWRALRDVSDRMFHYKHGDRGRNTWQTAQRGGEGEPFYYDAAGLAEGMRIITEAGQEVFRIKWGHRDCDIIKGAGLGIEDQWRVEKDWE